MPLESLKELMVLIFGKSNASLKELMFLIGNKSENEYKAIRDPLAIQSAIIKKVFLRKQVRKS
jgi:hypothetical protein